MKEIMKTEEVRRLMESIGNDFLKQKVWYNFSYDREMLMPLGGIWI